jgi:galactose-1-phosphate uridylyltransferase
LKFLASSETGAWATINDTYPEEKAAELREKVDQQLKSIGEVEG